MNSPRHRLLLIVAVAAVSAWWGLMFLGTHLPMPPKTHVSMNDKLQHAGAYAGLAFLLLGVLRAFWSRRFKPYLLAVIIGALYGVLDELTQLLVPNRSAELLDWVADLTGLVLGATAFVLVDLVLLSVRPWAAPQPIESTSRR